MSEDLCVTTGSETVTASVQVGAQSTVVVDLAVLDDGHRAVLVRERLITGFEVDDGEPSRGDRRRAVHVDAAAVRSAVQES